MMDAGDQCRRSFGRSRVEASRPWIYRCDTQRVVMIVDRDLSACRRFCSIHEQASVDRFYETNYTWYEHEDVVTMKASFPRQLLAGITLAIVGVYITLTLTAAGCPMLHGTPSSHDHHSTTDASSPLCAWACQAASDVGLVAQGPTGRPSIIGEQHPLWSVLPGSLSQTVSLRPRAPPIPSRG